MFMQFTDRTNPMEKHVPVLANKYGISPAPITPQMFASAGRDHMKKYGGWGSYTYLVIQYVGHWDHMRKNGGWSCIIETRNNSGRCSLV